MKEFFLSVRFEGGPIQIAFITVWVSKKNHCSLFQSKTPALVFEYINNTDFKVCMLLFGMGFMGLEGVGWVLLELQIKAVRDDVGEFGWQLRSQILQILVGVLEFGGVAHCLLTCFLKEFAALWDPLFCNKRCSASSITHLFYTAQF